MKSRWLIPSLAALVLSLLPCTATAGTGEPVYYSRQCCPPHCPFWIRFWQSFDMDYPFDFCYDYDNPRPCYPKDRH